MDLTAHDTPNAMDTQAQAQKGACVDFRGSPSAFSYFAKRFRGALRRFMCVLDGILWARQSIELPHGGC